MCCLNILDLIVSCFLYNHSPLEIATLFPLIKHSTGTMLRHSTKPHENSTLSCSGAPQVSISSDDYLRRGSSCLNQPQQLLLEGGIIIDSEGPEPQNNYWLLSVGNRLSFQCITELGFLTSKRLWTWSAPILSMLETTGPSITALMRAPSTESRGRINVLITYRAQK